VDGLDQAAALIVRNRILLGQAMAERRRAQQAVEAAKLAILSIMRAVRVAEENLRVRASSPFRSSPILSGDRKVNPRWTSAAVLREQAAKARRYARELAGDEAAQRLRELADELEAKAARMDRTLP
jgi:hypothetical protein